MYYQPTQGFIGSSANGHNQLCLPQKTKNVCCHVDMITGVPKQSAEWDQTSEKKKLYLCANNSLTVDL
jgi:hypothetical protein